MGLFLEDLIITILKNRFRNIKHEPYKNSLSDNVVSCIVEDEHSMLWIGTNDGGLNRYNPLDNSFQYYFLILRIKVGHMSLIMLNLYI